MPLIDILFLALVLYLLYRFVANFLLPVVRVTRQVREQFRHTQQPPNDAGQGSNPFQQQGHAQYHQHAPNPQSAKRTSGAKPPSDEYIDFEEVK